MRFIKEIIDLGYASTALSTFYYGSSYDLGENWRNLCIQESIYGTVSTGSYCQLYFNSIVYGGPYINNASGLATPGIAMKNSYFTSNANSASTSSINVYIPTNRFFRARLYNGATNQTAASFIKFGIFII